MKYLLVVLFLAAVAGLEILHELRSGDAPGASVCADPHTKQGAIDHTFLLHLQSHR